MSSPVRPSAQPKLAGGHEVSRTADPIFTRPFVLATLAYFCFYTHISSYNLLPLYLQTLGARAGQIGTIMAMFSAAAIVGQFVTGRLLGRGWRKSCLLLATGLLTVVAVALGFASRLDWTLYLLRFLQGLGFALYMASGMTLIAEIAPATRRAEAVGIYGTGGLVAVAVGPAFAEVILQAWGFPAFFAAALAMALMTAVLAALVSIPRATAVRKGPRLGWVGWAPFLAVLVPGFQYGLANTVAFFFLPAFARYAGLPRAGPFYIAYTGAAIVVRFLASGLSDRVGRDRVIVPALGAMAAGIMLCSTVRATWMLVAIGVLNGLGQGFVMPAANALAFEQAPSGRRGEAMALYTGANLLGGTLGAIGFGWVAQAFGYRPAFVVAGMFLMVGNFAFWRRH